MKKTIRIIACALVAVAATAIGGCSKKPTVVPAAAYTNMETVCLNQNGDGTLTVRAWGRGTSQSEAIEQAKKNALATVLFNGFSQGVQGAERHPLVMEVNGRERYDYYFAPFFRDGGKYRKYVKENSKSGEARMKGSTKSIDGYGVVLDVDRRALRDQLIKDGILKP